jgi:hypothetical protein
VTLPRIPRHTRFTIVQRDGAHVLQVEADRSYGSLMHRLAPADAPAAAAPILRWRWRVESAGSGADLTRKSGDDAPLRLCVLFDLPLDRLSRADALRVRIGRALFDPDLPAASLCYIWDMQLAAGTRLPNAYSARVMQWILEGATTAGWREERRDLRADFAAAFPAESARGPLPQVAAIAIVADGDDSGARSLAFVGDIVLGTE